MTKVNELSRSLAALDQDTTLIAVVELSSKSWLVAAAVPGIERHPLKKLDPDASALLKLIERCRREAERRAHDQAGGAGLRGGAGRLLAGALLTVRDIEPTSSIRRPCGLVREEARQDRSPRRGDAVARSPGLATRRARALLDGRDPEHGRGGRQAPEPRARDAGRRADAHHQPHQVRAGPLRHPQLQPAVAQGAPEPREAAVGGGRPPAAQYPGGDQARPRADRHGARADRGHREGARGPPQAALPRPAPMPWCSFWRA